MFSSHILLALWAVSTTVVGAVSIPRQASNSTDSDLTTLTNLVQQETKLQAAEQAEIEHIIEETLNASQATLGQQKASALITFMEDYLQRNGDAPGTYLLPIKLSAQELQAISKACTAVDGCAPSLAEMSSSSVKRSEVFDCPSALWMVVQGTAVMGTGAGSIMATGGLSGFWFAAGFSSFVVGLTAAIEEC